MKYKYKVTAFAGNIKEGDDDWVEKFRAQLEVQLENMQIKVGSLWDSMSSGLTLLLAVSQKFLVQSRQ